MKYKIMVLDIDGTLTNSEKKITPKTHDALIDYQERGGKIAIASGRPTKGILPYAEKLDLKKYGGFIPGLRPGKPTTDYLDKIMSRITLAGAIFLALIALMPNVVGWITGIEGIYFGGTALLIVVGVALDTMKQVESLVLMRHYQGFMK